MKPENPMPTKKVPMRNSRAFRENNFIVFMYWEIPLMVRCWIINRGCNISLERIDMNRKLSGLHFTDQYVRNLLS